jgi:hypothetical protein
MDYDYLDWVFGIVPLEPSPSPIPTATPPASYETPWWVDTINRGIERAAQVATVHSAGYPQYPNFPLPPPPSPTLPPVGTIQQPRTDGIQLSQTTLMLLVGGVLLFMLGSRRR